MYFKFVANYLVVAVVLSLATQVARASNNDDSTYSWSTPRMVVSYEFMGYAADGTIRAGVNSATLIDSVGKLRIIFQGGRPSDTKWSATSSDLGATWNIDTGFKWPTDIQVSFGHISVATAPEGGFRAFVRNETGIKSVYSIDGQSWTSEPGTRLTPEQFGLEKLDGGGVIRLPDGRYRMFVGDESSYFKKCVSDKTVKMKIYSATSRDQLNWIVDSGYRIGPEHGMRCNLHPHAFVDSAGKIGIVFHINNEIEKSNTEWQSSCHYAMSADGLNFNSVLRIPAVVKKTGGGSESGASDCDILALRDGRIFLSFSVFGPAPEGDQIAMSIGTPTIDADKSSKKSGRQTKKITCVKGKVTKVVTGDSPKCPIGYRKKG